jgi:hypothetical protein
MFRFLMMLTFLGLSAGSSEALAQERAPRPDSLQARLRLITERLDQLEAESCLPGADTVAVPEPAPTGVAASDSLARTVWRLELRVRRLILLRCASPTAGAAAGRDSAGDDLAALRAAAAAAAAAEDTAPAAGPVQFVGKQRSGSALNPEISATGDVRFVARDPGAPKDNAVMREVEVAFQSALDPYSNTKVFLTFSDEEIGIEEGYIYWTGLPGKLRVDVGKIRQQLGDLNRWHLHALPESDYPLVYQRFLGDEGLAGVGLSLYTALPVSLAGGTHELYLQATSAESEPLFVDSRQLSLLGRLQNFWQVNRSTYTQFGVTGVGGDNRDLDLQSRLVGADFRLTWRPPNAATRREITFRAEGYRLHASEAGAVTNRHGAFADLQFRAGRRWVLGARGDWAEAPRGDYGHDTQVVGAVTWWQSEFVYLRLEGRHARMDGADRNQVLAQVVWAMGPHKHETY